MEQQKDILQFKQPAKKWPAKEMHRVVGTNKWYKNPYERLEGEDSDFDQGQKQVKLMESNVRMPELKNFYQEF